MDKLLKAFGVFFVAIILGFLLNYPTMLIVNYLFAPTFLLHVFGVAKLTFWRTYLLSVLAVWKFGAK
jgi:hypothetical protein